MDRTSDRLAFDFDEIVDEGDQDRILSAFQTLLLDEQAYSARIGYLNSLTKAADRLNLTSHAPAETAFDEDIELLVREGTFGAVRSGKLTLDRIAEIARSPQALRHAHTVLAAALEGELDDTEQPVAAFPRHLVLPIAGQVLPVEIETQCTLVVRQLRPVDGKLEGLAELSVSGDDERPVEVYVDYLLTTDDGAVMTGAAFPNVAQTETVLSPGRDRKLEFTLQLPRPPAAGRIEFRAFAHTFAGPRRHALPTWAPQQRALVFGPEQGEASNLAVAATTSAVAVALGETTIAWPGGAP